MITIAIAVSKGMQIALF